MATTLSADRNTLRRDAKQYSFPVAASTKLYKGGAVCLDASGNAIAPTATTGQRTVGIALEDCDNSSGLAAALSIKVQAGCYRFDNYGSGLTKADIGSLVSWHNDVSVVAYSGSLSVAGIMRDIDSDGVWVELGYFAAASASYLLAASNLGDVVSAPAAATALGLGTGNSPTCTAVTTTAGIIAGTTLASGTTCAVGTALTVGTTAAITGAITGPSKHAIKTTAFSIGAQDVDGGAINQSATNGTKGTLPAVAAANKGMRFTYQNTGTGGACGITLGVQSGNYLRGTVAAVTLAGSLQAQPWEIGAATHPHPTLSEVVGEAAMAVDGRSINF